MPTEEPRIAQPTEEQQREYVSLRDDDATVVGIEGTNTRYRIHWLKNGQLVKLSRLLLNKHKDDAKDEGNDGESGEADMLASIIRDGKLSCKAAATFILNGYWKLKFCYWFLWRWFYYIKQYDCSQLLPLLNEGKKKVPLIPFYSAIMSLTEVKGTLMNMTMKEAEHTLQELRLAHDSPTASSSSGSTSRGTSSSGSSK